MSETLYLRLKCVKTASWATQNLKFTIHEQSVPNLIFAVKMCENI